MVSLLLILGALQEPCLEGLAVIEVQHGAAFAAGYAATVPHKGCGINCPNRRRRGAVQVGRFSGSGFFAGGGSLSVRSKGKDDRRTYNGLCLGPYHHLAVGCGGGDGNVHLVFGRIHGRLVCTAGECHYGGVVGACDGVRDGYGLPCLDLRVGNFFNDKLEGFHKGDFKALPAHEGEDYLFFIGHHAFKDCVSGGRNLAQVGLGAVHGHNEFTGFVYAECGNHCHGDFLAVYGEEFSVNGPILYAVGIGLYADEGGLGAAVFTVVDGYGFAAHERDGVAAGDVLDGLHKAAGLPLLNHGIETLHLGVQFVHLFGQFCHLAGQSVHLCLEAAVIVLPCAGQQRHRRGEKDGDDVF